MPNPDAQGPATTVLVVDDEDGIRQALDRFLTRLGYKVLQAASAAEALDRQAEAQPQAMPSDIRMPNMSGWELVPTALALDSDHPNHLPPPHGHPPTRKADGLGTIGITAVSYAWV